MRYQRERDRKRLNENETEELYIQEIDNLKDRIQQLEDQLAARATEKSSSHDEGLFPQPLMDKLGPEIYLGEYSDRLRFVANEMTNRADQIGLDRRTRHFLTKISDCLPSAPALAALLSELKRSTRDGSRMASEVTQLLSRCGYREKSDNKHIKLEAKGGYEGLEAITLSKTPSDHRGLQNMRKDIERVLGISKL